MPAPQDKLEQPPPSSRTLGAYSPHSNEMRVSVNDLNIAASGNTEVANSLRFTLGHDIEHAAQHDALLESDKAFEDSVRRIATGPSPHDYTAPLKAYNERECSLEVAAEIAGFNILADYVRNTYPNATLKDLYLASRGDMRAYIDEDRRTKPRTYALKPGLTLDNNLKMPSTQANRDAMGKYFYEANGYPERKVGVALNYIATLEHNVLNAARAAPPPSGFNDTSP